jgi:arsenate reductase (glutaredoxin)
MQNELIIYHNPRCSKSRAGLKYLEENNIEHKVRLYLTDLLSEEELTELIKKTGLKPEDLVRKHEDLYKKEYKGSELSNEQWIKVIVENPRLLHRPLIEKGDKAVFAQPPEKVLSIL